MLNARPLLFCLMLLLPNVWAAETSSGTKSVNLISGDFDTFSRKSRKEIAIDLKKEVNDLLFQVPIQNPDDLAWLESEKREIDQIENSQKNKSLDRTVAYVGSKQFQHRQLRSLLINTSEALSCILEANISIKREMMCWTVASSNLMEKGRFSDSISTLRKHGILPKKVDSSFEEDYWYQVYGKGIIDYIVLPYLRSQSKQ
jgi:hypothetical protein